MILAVAVVAALIFTPLGFIFLIPRRQVRNWHWITLVVMGFALFITSYFQFTTGFGFPDRYTGFVRGMSGFTGLASTVAIITGIHLRSEVRWSAKKDGRESSKG